LNDGVDGPLAASTCQTGVLQITRKISEGRKRARQNGIKFDRKPKLTAYQRQEALERLAQGESQSTIARSFNVDRATISRLAVSLVRLLLPTC
jgi:DNA invertase Pin-like site-specific DNA recombinase